MANERYAILPASTTSNWSSTGTWSDSHGGGTGASVPTSTNPVIVDDASVAGASAVLSADAAANCASLDFTGATNNPTLSKTAGTYLNVYGDVTFIAAMTVTGAGALQIRGTGILTTNGVTITTTGDYLWISGAGITVSLADDLTCTNIMVENGTLATANHTINTGQLYTYNAGTSKGLTPGSSTLNCTAFDLSVGTVAVAANTATINVAGIGKFAGGSITTYNNINLNGSTHTVSGSFTCVNLTRHPSSHAITDTVTFTSGTTVTVTGTFTVNGDIRATQLLVQSSTLGSAATINAAVVSLTACSLMDITGAGAASWDLSAQTDIGDWKGNTGITFPASISPNNWAYGGVDHNYNTAGNWSGGRVPLAQDDVVVDTTGQTVVANTKVLGRNVTISGTGTLILSNDENVFGSLTLGSGITYTHSNKANYMRGRGNYSLTTNGITLYSLQIRAPSGTVTQGSALTLTSELIFYSGTLTTSDNSISTTKVSDYLRPATITIALNLGASTISIASSSTGVRWEMGNVTSTGITLNAGTSTIILSNSGTNGQTFAGGDLTYNNVTVTGSGNYALTITGNNTFNTFTVDRSVANKTLIATGTTQTVSSFSVPVSGTRTLTITGGTWTFITRNQMVSDYLTISGSTANGANKWFAGTHSTDSGGNVGWVFGNPKVLAGPTQNLVTLGVV